MAGADGGEADVGASELAEALRAHAPFLLPIQPLQRVGFGYNSYVFMTASGWIVRVARSAEAAARHLGESVFLSNVAPQLSVAVPTPRRALSPSAAAPFGATAYRSLPGRVMTEADATAPGWERIAEDLGRNLAMLHSIPAEAIPGLPTPKADRLVQLHQATAAHLRKRVSEAEWRRVEAWWASLSVDSAFVQTALAVTHGDPKWQNLMVAESRLSGILDWEFVSQSDPANDLGVTLYMGEPFFDAVLGAYTACRDRWRDPTLEHRARRLFATCVFYGMQVAIERQDEAEWVDALRKLREGPILSRKT